MRKTSLVLFATVALAALSLSGCAVQSSTSGNPSSQSDTPITVGLLTSLSGANAVTGEMWKIGFYAGLDYATKGSNKVGAKTVKVVEADDQSDPNVATTQATTLVSNGASIITGTQSSGIALGLADFAVDNDILYITGSANSNDITGKNANTFRASRQAYQDVQTIVAILGDAVAGKRVTILAHDIAYGQSLIATIQPLLTQAGATVEIVLAPFPTTDVAPYVQQVKDSNPDVIIPFWSGDVDPLWTAFTQQDVYSTAEIVAGLGTRGTFPTFQAITSPNVKLFNSWTPGLDNAANKALVAAIPTIDYISADGFLAAQMVVKAVGDADDTKGRIAALEGATIDGPRGATTISAKDHALIAPMFEVKFDGDNLVSTGELSADKIAPPVK